MTRFAILLLFATSVPAVEPIVRPASNTDPSVKTPGLRPYEMVWVDRTPAYPELADFEDLTGWTVAGFRGCSAELFRSREEQMFGVYTAKAVYRGASSASSFELRPPKPMAIPGKPTAVQLWVRGNNWGWHPKPRTARTHVDALVRDAKGETFEIPLGTVNFDYWSLLHATFVPPAGGLAGIRRSDGDGKLDYPLSFTAIRVLGCSDERPAKLSFDSLQFYEARYEPLPALRLPPSSALWPTTPETITPTPTEDVVNSVRQEGASYVLEAKGTRDTIRWLYTPKTGTLSDLAVEVNGRRFQPCVGGGPVFELDGVTHSPATALAGAPLGIEVAGDTVIARWRIVRGLGSARFEYRLRAKGKSLQIGVASPGEAATGFRIGHAAGTPGAELIRVPYLTLGNVGPHVVHWDGVFLSGLLDWYNSDASEPYTEHGTPKPGEIIYNGGSRYLPKTDGRRNPLRERLIVTVATDFHEVLPHIPHPRNPNAEQAVASIWRNIGSPNRDLLKRLKAYGVERFICPLHEVGWRDAGESFTFRLNCAPRIGDEAMKDYGAWVKTLGYHFGLYANYTDYAPVNGFWREDRVCLRPDGNWTGAWPRCYAPKPTWAWQAEAVLAPSIARKFGATTCYSDVHTAVTPWARTDYDARAPGAGMFRSTWACYAQVLWNECRAYGGPVFSEGRVHWMYAGLISGNYAQITGPERWRVPPLVDFDLLKMHPLMTDFGMGMPSMFYDRHGTEWRRERSRTSPWLDRFVTSTLAFGHIGYLALDWGFEGALKCYYMTNAVQQHYALKPAEAIRYFDGTHLLTTSEAIRTGAFRRGQVYVRYADGLELWCNLSFEHNWRVTHGGQAYELPPTGHLAVKPGELLQYSGLVEGQRVDYVRCDAYTYIDTRDAIASVGPVVCKGAVVLRRDGERAWAVTPMTRCDELSFRPGDLGFGQQVALGATATDIDGEPLGEATMRVSNLGSTLLPVEGAARYRVRATGPVEIPPADKRLRRLIVGLDQQVGAALWNRGDGPLAAPGLVAEWMQQDGKVVPIGGATVAEPVPPRDEAWTALVVRVPASAKPGERLWIRVRATGAFGKAQAQGEAWLAAVAAEAIEAEIAPRDPAPQRPGGLAELTLTLRSNLPDLAAVTLLTSSPSLKLRQLLLPVALRPGVEKVLRIGYVVPKAPGVAPVDLELHFPPGKTALRRWLRFTTARPIVADLAKATPSRTGIRYRGKGEEPLRADSGASFYAAKRPVGGAEKAGFFCHPPYKGGTGLAFGEFDVTLPDEPCAFEASVGFSDGSTTQDGCVFAVHVRDGGRWETAGEVQHATLKQWKAFRADLSKYRGRKIALRLVTDVGPKDDSNSDWAVWGEPRVVVAADRLLPEIFETKPTLPIGPPLKPIAGLKAADLTAVAEAKIVFDGCGVDSGEYRSDMLLNGVSIGHTPGSTKGDSAWTENQALVVPGEALKTLGPHNLVAIRNRRNDCFKVRRIRLWFRLRDGREGTSVVVNGPFTSPPTWLHAEGTLVPEGHPIRAQCDIPVAE